MSSILLIGDSYLEGLTRFLPAELNRRGFNPVEIAAQSGWSTRKWLNEGNIGGVVRTSQPDLSVVMLGTNDEGAGGASYREKIADVVSLATSTGAKVLWVTGFVGDGLGGRYIDTKAVLGAARVIEGSSLVRGLLEGENLHPTVDGYKHLAPRLANAINARFKPEGRSMLIPVAVGAAVAGLVLWALEG